MTLKQQILNDAVHTFINDDEFAEAVTYTPYAGSSIVRSAQVVRSQADSASEEGGRILQNQAEVYLANDATYGVGSVAVGKDKITFTDLKGILRTWLVIDIIDVDNGMFHLRVSR